MTVGRGATLGGPEASGKRPLLTEGGGRGAGRAASITTKSPFLVHRVQGSLDPQGQTGTPGVSILILLGGPVAQGREFVAHVQSGFNHEYHA